MGDESRHVLLREGNAGRRANEDHVCIPPNEWLDDGAIVKCDICGRRWRARLNEWGGFLRWTRRWWPWPR